MRLLLSGDWHLGKIINQTSMLEEQAHALEQLQTIITKERVDCLMVSGDIYDRAIPPKEAVELFDRFVSTCVARGVQIILIAGNHDSQERLAFGRDILASGGLHIADKFRGQLEPLTLKDAHGLIDVTLIPFAPFQMIRAVYDDPDITTYHQAYKRMLKDYSINPDRRNVLMTHAFVRASHSSVDVSDSEKTLAIGGVEVVDAALFDAFDYVVLGHLHKPQVVGKETCRYTGSLCKYSFSEASHTKSVILLDLGPKGQLSQSLIPLMPKRDFVILKDTFNALLQDTDRIAKHKHDFIKIIVTDQEEISEPVPRLRQAFPHIMEFAYAERIDTAFAESMMRPALAEKLQSGKSQDFAAIFLDLFEDFAKQTADLTLTDVMRRTLTETLETVLKAGRNP